MLIGTVIDGFVWEMELDPRTGLVELWRTPFPNACGACAGGNRCEPCGRPAMHLVAVGEWNGDTIELREMPNPRGTGFNAKRYLAIFASILHTATQN